MAEIIPKEAFQINPLFEKTKKNRVENEHKIQVKENNEEEKEENTPIYKIVQIDKNICIIMIHQTSGSGGRYCSNIIALVPYAMIQIRVHFTTPKL